MNLNEERIKTSKRNFIVEGEILTKYSAFTMLALYLMEETKQIRLTTHTNSSRKADCENTACFFYAPILVHILLYNRTEQLNKRESGRDGICLIKINPAKMHS